MESVECTLYIVDFFRATQLNLHRLPGIPNIQIRALVGVNEVVDSWPYSCQQLNSPESRLFAFEFLPAFCCFYKYNCSSDKEVDISWQQVLRLFFNDNIPLLDLLLRHQISQNIYIKRSTPAPAPDSLAPASCTLSECRDLETHVLERVNLTGGLGGTEHPYHQKNHGDVSFGLSQRG
jgi:hypothetical protein